MMVIRSGLIPCFVPHFSSADAYPSRFLPPSTSYLSNHRSRIAFDRIATFSSTARSGTISISISIDRVEDEAPSSGT